MYLFGGSCHKDHGILGSVLGVPLFRETTIQGFRALRILMGPFLAVLLTGTIFWFDTSGGFLLWPYMRGAAF